MLRAPKNRHCRGAFSELLLWPWPWYASRYSCRCKGETQKMHIIKRHTIKCWWHSVLSSSEAIELGKWNCARCHTTLNRNYTIGCFIGRHISCNTCDRSKLINYIVKGQQWAPRILFSFSLSLRVCSFQTSTIVKYTFSFLRFFLYLLVHVDAFVHRAAPVIISHRFIWTRRALFIRIHPYDDDYYVLVVHPYKMT